MKISPCTHYRICGNYDQEFNCENYINFIEQKYNIDFRSIPQWKELIRGLNAPKRVCMQKIKEIQARKKSLINKIYAEISRPSPFKLTYDLARTAKTWEEIESKRKLHCSKTITKTGTSETYIIDPRGFEEVIDSSRHYNTEIKSSELSVAAEETEKEKEEECESHLPRFVCVNPNKRVSQLSFDESLNLKSLKVHKDGNKNTQERLLLQPTSDVKCKEITLTNATLDEQSLTFSLINVSTDCVYIQFKCVTDKNPFAEIQITPISALKLYPGLALNFKIIFKLATVENFSPTNLYFRVARNILLNLPYQSLLIPIKSMFNVRGKIYVSKTVHIAPAYSWHINEKYGFPKAYVEIINDDKVGYHVQVMNRCYEPVIAKDSHDSLSANALNTESILERNSDSELRLSHELLSAQSDLSEANESNNIKYFITCLVFEVVEISLEPFVLEHTYLNLKPLEKRHVPVKFTKAKHTGYHQCRYDFKFKDPENETYLFSKPTIIYAEVLPHPIRIEPIIFDMSNTRIIHGHCFDNFVVKNTHIIHGVNVKLQLTTKMKKLFHIHPLEVRIPENSEVRFFVKLCVASPTETDDYVHFTIKIRLSGYKTIYENVPPLYYEMIIPCAEEFKKMLG